MKILNYFFVVIFMYGCAHQSLTQSLSSRIDELINAYGVEHGFMGSVLVAEKGNIIYQTENLILSFLLMESTYIL